MTRHRIAQIGENRNPKSPENRPQTRRFLQIRLLQLRRSATPFNGLAVLHGRLINLGLHSHEKALPDEAKSVSQLGMKYIHIPVDFQNPTEEDFNRFCSEMEQLKETPVHVHCIANYRVSAFFYRYRRDVLGMDETQARAEMEEI